MNLEEAKRVNDDLIADDFSETSVGLSSIVNDLQLYCHGSRLARGVWGTEKNPAPIGDPAYVAAKLAELHLELSNALSALKSDTETKATTPGLKFLDALAGVLIQTLDLSGALGVNVGDTLAMKLRYDAKSAEKATN